LKLIVLVLVFLVGWEVVWWIIGVQPVGPWRMRALLKNEPARDLRLIDVRTQGEYQWFHIPGAVNYPDLLLHPEKLSVEAKERPVVLICVSGHRAPVAGFRLKQLGFKSISYLCWGMLAWLLSGGETVGG
jgi:rhodanese-related sulfurtransferase